MKQKKYILVFLIVLMQKGFGQKSVDTAALVKEFTKVMAFSTQPYLYYTTVTKMDALPLLNDKDTVSANGVFYKDKERMYCNTTKDEMYIEDSLVVQINNENKTIWISKANASSFEKMNAIPATTKKMMEALKKNYTISKVKTSEGLTRLSFETRKQPHSNSTTSSLIILEYSEKTQLPTKLSIGMNMQQPVDEEMMASLKNEGVDEHKLIQNIGGINYMVSMQRMNLLFTNIDIVKKRVTEIPSYQERIKYDSSTGKFVGKGMYEEYEITKTF